MMALLADIQLTPAVTLKPRRCFRCGRWYAVEEGVVAQCPTCAQREIDAAAEAQRHAERSAAATRGALSRLKTRRKRP